MKTLQYIFCVIFIFVISGCETDYFPDGGLIFSIHNSTENTYNGQKTLYIGAVVNNTFYVTDSIVSNDFIDKRISPTAVFGKDIFYGWKPNLKKLKSKSSNGLLLFKLSNEKQLFFRPFGFPQTMLDQANLIVTIKDSGLIYNEDPNKNIKQDYEIVK